MQVGVNPGAGLVVDVLGDLMGRTPIAFCVVPERAQRRRERRRGLFVRKRSLEV
jgi:hypothetical protein